MLANVVNFVHIVYGGVPYNYNLPVLTIILLPVRSGLTVIPISSLFPLICIVNLCENGVVFVPAFKEPDFIHILSAYINISCISGIIISPLISKYPIGEGFISIIIVH